MKTNSDLSFILYEILKESLLHMRTKFYIYVIPEYRVPWLDIYKYPLPDTCTRWGDLLRYFNQAEL